MRRGIDSPVVVEKSRRGFLRQLQTSLDVEKFLEQTMGISEYWQVDREITHRCVLPFGLHAHGDANPSSSFNVDSLLVNCWVCGGGDIFWWVSNVKGVSIEEAVELVGGSLTPTEMTYSDFVAELESYWEVPEEISLSLPKYSTAILAPWKRYSPYLDARGIGREVQKEFSTGVDYKNRDLIRVEGKETWIEQTRVVVPIFFKGHLRGWLKRKVDPEQIGAKYKNSPGLPRHRILYGFDQVSSESPLIVVESTLSVLRLQTLGYRNVVATLGAKVSPDQVFLLRGFDVLLWMDADAPGRKSTKSLAESLSNYTKVWAIDYPEGEVRDPAEFDSREDVDRFIEENKIPYSLIS